MCTIFNAYMSIFDLSGQYLSFVYSMRKDSFFFSGRVAVNIICYIIHHPTGVGKSDFKHSELFYRHGLNACFYYFITVTSDSSFIRILIKADFQ